MEKEKEEKGTVEIATMSKEEIAQAVEDGKVTVEDVMEYSKALEAEHKTSMTDKDRQILNDRLNKIEKLKSKEETSQKTETEPTTEETVAQDIDVRDLVTLGKFDINEDSEEALVLKQFKDAGLIKDYKSGIEDVAVKAKLEAIKADRIATEEVDKNSDEEAILSTKNDIIKNYQETGDEPESDYEKEAVVESMLDDLGTVA